LINLIMLHEGYRSWSSFLCSCTIPYCLVPRYLHEDPLELSGLFPNISNCLTSKWIS
jgi:hypothetical protein